MRWLLLVTAACSFEHGALQTDGAGSQMTGGDAGPIDARPIDGPPDAPSQCVTSSTATYMGHHYFATASNASWANSHGACLLVGGHLVKIETTGENTFIQTTFGSGYTWIGLSDPLDTDVYAWADGSLLGLGFNDFAGGVPPMNASNCVDTNNTAWDVFSCSYAGHGGVCECE